MANVPETLHYSKDHEWVRVEGDTAVIGITDHAQDQLGDVVFAALWQFDVNHVAELILRMIRNPNYRSIAFDAYPFVVFAVVQIFRNVCHECSSTILDL